MNKEVLSWQGAVVLALSMLIVFLLSPWTWTYWTVREIRELTNGYLPDEAVVQEVHRTESTFFGETHVTVLLRFPEEAIGRDNNCRESGLDSALYEELPTRILDDSLLARFDLERPICFIVSSQQDAGLILLWQGDTLYFSKWAD